MAVRKNGHARYHVALRHAQSRFLGLAAACAGNVLPGGISVAFRVGLKAQIKIPLAALVQVGEHNAQHLVPAPAQNLCALVGHIAKRLAGFLHQAYLFAAHIAAAIEHIGYRALRHTRGLCDIFNGNHVPPAFENCFVSKQISPLFKLIIPKIRPKRQRFGKILPILCKNFIDTFQWPCYNDTTKEIKGGCFS